MKQCHCHHWRASRHSIEKNVYEFIPLLFHKNLKHWNNLNVLLFELLRKTFSHRGINLESLMFATFFPLTVSNDIYIRQALLLQSVFLHFLHALNLLFYIGIQPINNVAMVSGVQQSDSAMHTHASILPQLPSPPGSHMSPAITVWVCITFEGY